LGDESKIQGEYMDFFMLLSYMGYWKIVSI